MNIMYAKRYFKGRPNILFTYHINKVFFLGKPLLNKKTAGLKKRHSNNLKPCATRYCPTNCK